MAGFAQIPTQTKQKGIDIMLQKCFFGFVSAHPKLTYWGTRSKSAFQKWRDKPETSHSQSFSARSRSAGWVIPMHMWNAGKLLHPCFCVCHNSVSETNKPPACYSVFLLGCSEMLLIWCMAVFQHKWKAQTVLFPNTPPFWSSYTAHLVYWKQADAQMNLIQIHPL